MIWLLVACGGSDTDLPSVPDDLPPVANAGGDLAPTAEQTVALDGRGSYDPEGNSLIFRWAFDSVPDGSAIADREAPFGNNLDTSGTTTFRPDEIGVYVIELTVWDGVNTSLPDWVVVDVLPPSTPPVADAGADQTVDAGTAATLDGQGSFDPLGGELAWSWTLVDAPERSALTAGSLSGADGPTPQLTPDVPGDYAIALVVTSDLAASEPDVVMVRALGDDEPPVAVAGPDLAGEMCTSLALDCSGSSDPEGRSLDVQWAVQDSPEGSTAGPASFTDDHAAVTDFWADATGDYLLSCSVSDGASWSVPDLVEVAITERTANERPAVNAGADRYVSAGSATCTQQGSRWNCGSCPAVTVELGTDGSVTDADGDPFTLAWSQSEGDPTYIADPTVLATEVLLPTTEPVQPGSCTDTEFRFKLEAIDCPGGASIDSVTLSVECCGTL